jgi:hypothetical protein
MRKLLTYYTKTGKKNMKKQYIHYYSAYENILLACGTNIKIPDQLKGHYIPVC